jgi:hypothetical protein
MEGPAVGFFSYLKKRTNIGITMLMRSVLAR